MSEGDCGASGKKKNTYTGAQVGDFNYVGDFNFVAGGADGTGISAGTTVSQFFPFASNRRPWLRADARLDQNLLDTAYPTIDLRWTVDIILSPTVTFRVSDQSFYVQDETGYNHYYDARLDKGPTINVTVGEWLQSNYEVSDIKLVLNNRDGLYNDYLPYGDSYKQWSGAKVIIKVGFGEKISNYMTLFEGQVTVKNGLSTTRDTIEIKAYDKLDNNEVPFPPRVFSTEEFPDIAEELAGKAIPIIYGDWTENVPTYGAIEAFCVNPFEEELEDYLFKVSDVELESIDAVFLHRGDRVADKPGGPIPIAENVIIKDLPNGQFTIAADTLVLDQPSILLDRAKAGVGSGTGVITSDGSINYLDAGVKVGDVIIDQDDETATVTFENLKYTARTTGEDPLTGALGNGITVSYVYLTKYTDPKASLDLVVEVTGTDIIVGIPSKDDTRAGHEMEVLYGSTTANAIRAAINNHISPTITGKKASDLVKVSIVGTVPISYPPGTTQGEVEQTIPSGVLTLTGGADGGGAGVVTAVSNFQLNISGGGVYAEGQEYTVSTRQYTYLKGDKFSVVCKGKSLSSVSETRLVDINSLITRPVGIAIGFDKTFWLADNDTQKVYNLGFDKTVLKEIPYSDIDPSITSLSTICLASDNYIWVVDAAQSKIFRYNHEANQLGLTIATIDVTGLAMNLANITGLAVRPDNKFWIVDQATGEFYLIDAFSTVNPFVDDNFDTSDFDALATNIMGLAYDYQNLHLLIIDRSTGTFYRIDESNLDMINTVDFSLISDQMELVTGIGFAQDGSFFIMDEGTLSAFNYNDLTSASTNPAFVARDLLQQFGGHTYEDFDLSWNQTANQLSVYKTRAAFKDKTNLVTCINQMLSQFNTVFHLRFGAFALFYIHFDNFRTTGLTFKEKDIIEGTFKPSKEVNQYFNTASADYAKLPFDDSTTRSDTYVSPAAISFLGREVTKTLKLDNVYRRADIDRLLPLYVRLSTPDPEFVDVTVGFRLIRTQMQDFLNILFDSEIDPVTGKKDSGRRFNNVPAMVRKIEYNLDSMTVKLKLWSLGSTAFPGYVPDGVVIGGSEDPIVLSNIGRLGYISPVGNITGSAASSVDLSVVDGQNAETRADVDSGLAWKPGYIVDLVDAATRSVVTTLTIDSVLGDTVTFTTPTGVSVSNTGLDVAGFIATGHYLRYSSYNNLTEAQKALFASFGNPEGNYPSSKTQELQEQRGGLHNFADSGQPYILYPQGFTIYE